MFSSNTSSAAGDVNYIEDVFSTWLYTGNGSTQTITNGIDLAGKGGLVWIKARSAALDNVLFDTARGTSFELRSNATNGNISQANGVTAFNASGFNIGTFSSVNSTGNTLVSWTFREQPKFFDIVTYTGNDAVNRDIAHSIGGTVGCVIIKKTSNTSNWNMASRTADGRARFLFLNQPQGSNNVRTSWFNDSTFKVGTSDWPSTGIFGNAFDTNQSGATYVAYIFAHNAGGFGLTGTDNVISCGEFDTDGSGNATVNLGYEPQWVILKYSGADTGISSPTRMLDTMRGWNEGDDDRFLSANLAAAESGAQFGTPTSTGFTATTQFGASNSFIYIAIRRPMKVPTTGTSVFKPQVITANGAINAGFPSDSTLTAVESSLRPWPSRLTGGKPIYTNNTNAESGSSFYNYGFSQNSYDYNFGTGSFSRATMYDFRRAPGFFDVVCYTGTGVARTVAHNLAAVPELMIIKGRSYVEDWAVYSASLPNTQALRLNSAGSPITNSLYWNSTTPTSSVFTVGTRVEVNNSGGSIVAYLFASCPGVSKVGSYTGNGSSQTINCGFTGGARFVMIKRTDDTGDWYVWDTARGIVSGNDPHLSLNTTAAEVTTDDTIDTDSTGFVVNQVSATNVNVSSATYIFLAIA
jgi:hypothetical protein